MTAIIANDTLENMDQLGTDIGDFMGNLAPGLGKFILIFAIFGGVAGIIAGVIYLIKKKINL